MLYNLTHNAIKYRSYRRPLKIKVTAEKQKDYVVIKVIDNGNFNCSKVINLGKVDCQEEEEERPIARQFQPACISQPFKSGL